MSGCVIAAFRNGGKHQLSNLEPLGFELLFFDQGEGVHGNLLQRLKPRCLLEIELRHSNVANVLIIYMIYVVGVSPRSRLLPLAHRLTYVILLTSR